MYKTIQCILSLTFLLYKNSTSCNKKQIDPQIRQIHVVYNTPIVNWDSTVTDINIAYDAYYYGEYFLYKLPYHFDSLYNGQLVFEEWRYNFFVFQKDSTVGYYYYLDPLDTRREKRFSVDSVLAKNTYENPGYDSLINRKPDSAYYDKEANLVNLYLFPPEKKRPENNKYYLYYTRELKGIKETFSRKLDSLKQMKLFRVKIVAGGGWYEEYKIAFPKRQYLLEMREIPVENKEEVLKYFDRYKSTQK